MAFNISDHPTVKFAIKPLKEVLEQLPELAYRTTVHTDQGLQYQNQAWQGVFFHIMKAEVMDEHFESKESLAAAMTSWIDFYNKRRIKTKLNGKSTVKYRELAVQKAA